MVMMLQTMSPLLSPVASSCRPPILAQIQPVLTCPQSRQPATMAPPTISLLPPPAEITRHQSYTGRLLARPTPSRGPVWSGRENSSNSKEMKGRTPLPHSRATARRKKIRLRHKNRIRERLPVRKRNRIVAVRLLNLEPSVMERRGFSPSKRETIK